MIFTYSSMEFAYCNALRARENSGLPLGSNSENPVMVVSVTIKPEELIPKSSSLTMMPGKPSWMMRKPCVGTMSNTMVQRLPTGKFVQLLCAITGLWSFVIEPVATKALQWPGGGSFCAAAPFC